MLFDDKTKGIAQSYLSMLGESHFKVGDKVKCKASGMSGTVTKLDEPETGKYYTVKQDSGKVMKYAPDELKKLNEAMDQVNPKAVKKKFDDRKDKDIDNDGDTDSSDEYLHKRRKAISKATKEEVEIEINKKKMKNGEKNDEDDDDDEAVVVKKKGKDKGDVEQVDELSTSTLQSYKSKTSGSVNKRVSPTASKAEVQRKDRNQRVGGSSADNKIIKKAFEDFEWNWDAILEAPAEELDAMIEEMSDEELNSFVTEFESIEEGNQLSTNSVQPMSPDGRETLDPRAPADRAFANAHRQQVDIKDYPGKDKPVNNAKAQAPLRTGDKRNSEPKKTLSDIRNQMK